MKISKQARRDAKDLLRCCMPEGLMQEAKVRMAVQELVTRKPRGYVAILSHFQRLLRLELERRSGRVESAVPLGDAQKAELQTRLGKLYGSGLNLVFETNPALLGGVRIRVGSDVYDGSVQSRLEALRASF